MSGNLQVAKSKIISKRKNEQLVDLNKVLFICIFANF